MQYHRQNDDPREVTRGYNGKGQRRFARAGATCDADYAGVGPWRAVVGLLYDVLLSVGHGWWRTRNLQSHDNADRAEKI
jgi:hypothetical protein